MKTYLCLSLIVALNLAAQNPPSAEVPWKEVVSNDGSWVVRWRLIVDGKPAELPLPRKRFTLELQIESKRDPEETPRALLVDAQMPEHGHGMNVQPTTTLDALSDGAARGSAEGMLFHMTGRWEVDVDIDDGTTSERAQWNIGMH